MNAEDIYFAYTEALNLVLYDNTVGAARVIRLLTSREQDDLLGALEVLTEVIWAVQEDETNDLLSHEKARF